MIEYTEDPKDQYLEIRVKGTVDKSDMERVQQLLAPRLEQWENIHMLKVVKDFDGMTMEAVWEDLKLALNNIGHLSHIKKCAVVVDQDWMEKVGRVFSQLMKGEVEFFDEDEVEEARTWLRPDVRSKSASKRSSSSEMSASH